MRVFTLDAEGEAEGVGLSVAMGVFDTKGDPESELTAVNEGSVTKEGDMVTDATGEKEARGERPTESLMTMLAEGDAVAVRESSDKRTSVGVREGTALT